MSNKFVEHKGFNLVETNKEVFIALARFLQNRRAQALPARAGWRVV